MSTEFIARKIPAGLLILLLLPAIRGNGQDSQHGSPVSVTPDAVQALALSPASRSKLEAALRTRDYGAAEELLYGETKSSPKPQRVLLLLAGIFFLDGKHLNCAVALKKAEKFAPLDERSRFLLALSYVTIGKLDWAKPEFERLAQSNPPNAVYRYWLSRIFFRKLDYHSALSHTREATLLDPGFIKAFDQLGLCYEAAGDNEEAIKAFEEAIRLNERHSTLPVAVSEPRRLAVSSRAAGRVGGSPPSLDRNGSEFSSGLLQAWASA